MIEFLPKGPSMWTLRDLFTSFLDAHNFSSVVLKFQERVGRSGRLQQLSANHSIQATSPYAIYRFVDVIMERRVVVNSRSYQNVVVTSHNFSLYSQTKVVFGEQS